MKGKISKYEPFGDLIEEIEFELPLFNLNEELIEVCDENGIIDICRRNVCVLELNSFKYVINSNGSLDLIE